MVIGEAKGVEAAADRAEGEGRCAETTEAEPQSLWSKLSNYSYGLQAQCLNKSISTEQVAKARMVEREPHCEEPATAKIQ